MAAGTLGGQASMSSCRGSIATGNGLVVQSDERTRADSAPARSMALHCETTEGSIQ